MALRLPLNTKTIGAKLFSAFVAMGLIAGALGLYGIYVLTQAGGIVVETYDKPLMATNFARSASLTFSIMERENLRRAMAPDQAAEIDANIESLLKSFFDDLKVAEDRALAPDERTVIAHIRIGTQQWDDLRRNPDPRTAARLEALSSSIVDDFDRLIELIAGHSFVARRKAVWSIAYFRYTSIAATAVALLFAVALTVVLTRRIIRPLSDAATVADRIGDGEFEAPIPAPTDDEAGRLLRSLAVMQARIRSMMEREKAEARSAQLRLADALEHSQEGMMLVDAAQRIVSANPPFKSFFPALEHAAAGTPFGDVVGAISVHLSDDDDALRAPASPRAQAAGLAHDGEYRLGDGRWITLSSNDTRDGGFFLFAIEQTAAKQREDGLREAKRLAEAASSAKSAFLANMSHELRTPLNAVIGFAEMLTAQVFGPLGNERYHEYATAIANSGRHLLEVINSVLELAKSEQGNMPLRPEPVDLGAVLNDCVTMIRPQCTRAGLALHFTPIAEPITVLGERAKLRQIFLNLLSNAVKFTEAGQVAVELASEPGRLSVRITDSGIGMRPEDIPTALAPFGQIDSRLARRYEGTGLGLPLAKNLIELHGGTLDIASTPERGTTVTVSLPAAGVAALLPTARVA